MKSRGEPFTPSLGDLGDILLEPMSDLGDIFFGLEPRNCKNGLGLAGLWSLCLSVVLVDLIGWFGVLALSSCEPDMML